MNVEIPEIKLTITYYEAVDLYCAVRDHLKKSIETHWVNHPDAYREHEGRTLVMLREFCRVTGRDWRDEEKQLDDLLKACVIEKEKKQADRNHSNT